MQKSTGKTSLQAVILPPTSENLTQLGEAIRKDEIGGMPTETVYGLAGNAFSPKALARIFDAKERPTFDPLIIHVAPPSGSLKHFGIPQLEELCLVNARVLHSKQKESIHQLIQAFWPGPLTLVLPKHEQVPDLATSGLPTVALRMPNHPVAQALIAASKTPLAAPSANRFGKISPTTAQAVYEELGDRIPWILEGGESQIGLESTILSFPSKEEVHLLRPGGIPAEKIEALLGTLLIRHKNCSSSGPLISPGLLESHYAPTQPFRILPKPVRELTSEDLRGIYQGLDPISPQAQIGLILMSGDPPLEGYRLEKLIKKSVMAKTLSSDGNLQEVAHSLFSTLRSLDRTDIALILIEPCPHSEGLGYAIMDRLKRASAGKP